MALNGLDRQMQPTGDLGIRQADRQKLQATVSSCPRTSHAAKALTPRPRKTRGPISRARSRKWPPSEGTIRRECQEVNGAYASRTKDGNRLSSCAYRDIDGALHTDYYNSGVYSHTEDADGNLEHA